MKSIFTLLLSILVTIGYNRVQAQVTTAVISGKVADDGGQAIPGVTVVILNNSTGAKSGVQTNNDGRYILPNLNPGGPYTITVSFIGYKKEIKSDVNLGLGTTSFNFKLQEESTALNEVVVTGTAGGSKAGGTKIGQEQIKRLPTLSRSLQDLTKVTPQSNNNSFLGTNYRYNNVTLDGAINNDAIGFSPSLGGQSNTSGQPGSSTRTNPVSLDAIQDVQVLLAPFDVKVGNFLGGSVNAVTRSGTNEVHGSIYGFGRNAAMVGKNNAGDGSKLPADFHEYQTGVRLGFPIIKNKLFFFTNEEITRRVDPIILAAGSADNGGILTEKDAADITTTMKSYGVDPGTAGNTSIYSNSNKFFNRIDWHINDKHQLSVRNNTITSEATNLERDQQNFRFKGIDYKQVNNQSSTVAELKSNFTSTFANSLILGYSNVHDYRNPLSDPAVPQIQIKGRTPGSTIFLGTDREASIFNMKQKTFEVLPQFRQRKAGVVVNVTSSVTLKALPLIAAYSASKAAVNAFTESTALEVEPFGVRVRLVLPGRAPDTRFGENARARIHGFDHAAYADLANKVVARLQDTSSPVTRAQDVAEAVWRAATDPSSPMRIPAGADAQAWAAEVR